MLREAEALTELAVDVGVSNVQLLTGPVSPGGPYSGPAELYRPSSDGSRPRRCGRWPISAPRTASATTWSPSPGRRSPRSPGRSRSSTRPSATTSGWSSTSGTCGNAGSTPDDVARLDRRVISGVDFADSLGPQGSGTPDQRSRCVWPGEGEIPLREWVHAVRSDRVRRLVGQRALQPGPLGMGRPVRRRRGPARGPHEVAAGLTSGRVC